jgi:acyl-CoA dehydrogenase
MRRHLFDGEHDRFRITIREFLTQEVLPVYPRWEQEGQPSRDFWRRAGDLGILGIDVPVEYGGLAGSDYRHSVVVTEEAQRLFLALGGLRVHTDICLPYFLRYATEEQKQRWLPRLTSGDAVVALGLSEPEAGSDLKAMATRAVRHDEHYVVNGAKTFISNGSAADLVVLAVKTDPGAGRHGITLLVVEADTPGFHRGRKLDKLGLKAQDLAELSFDDMHIPVADRLGEENNGFSYLTANLAQERLSIAVNSQAAAAATLDDAVRAAAGSEPGQHVKFTLAGCATEVRAGQALVDEAVRGLLGGDLSGADAAAVKLYCTELQGRVTDRCLQLAGRAGLRTGHVAGRAYFDGRVSRIYGGSSEIMKVIVAQGLGL